MLKYLDLDKLKIEKISNTSDTIITKGVSGNISADVSLKDINSVAIELVDELLVNLDNSKIYNFCIDLMDELDEENFETVVNVVVAAFFRKMTTNGSRARERRLDVPDNLKERVFCNMSLVKSAINAATLVDRFQLVITNRSLQYILAGDFNA